LTRDVSRTARATPLAGRDRRAFRRDGKSDFQLTCTCVGRRRKIRRTGTEFSHAQTRNLDRQSRRNGESRGCVVIERAAAILRTPGHLSAEGARRWFTRETLWRDRRHVCSAILNRGDSRRYRLDANRVIESARFKCVFYI